MRMGMGELLVVLAIVLLLFGARRLPELANGLGKAIKNFRRGMESNDDIEVTPVEKQVGEKSSATAVDSADAESKAVENGRPV